MLTGNWKKSVQRNTVVTYYDNVKMFTICITWTSVLKIGKLRIIITSFNYRAQLKLVNRLIKVTTGETRSIGADMSEYLFKVVIACLIHKNQSNVILVYSTTETYKIEFKGHCYEFNKQEYSSIEQLVECHKNEEGRIYLNECIPPSEYGK